MKKITICHIAVSHNRYDSRIFKKECVSLAKAGYEVTLLVADGKEEETIEGVRIISSDISRGIRWLAPGEWMINGVKKSSKEISLLDRIRREINTHKYVLDEALNVNAEIYHLHEPILLPLAKILKKKGLKVVFDSHEDNTALILDMNFMPRIVRMLIYPLFRTYYNFMIKKLDALISVTPHIVKKLKRVNKNTELITNFPILIKISTVQEKTHEIKFGFAGGITSQWNHETILDALEGLDTKYELMGVGAGPYFENLQKHKSWEKVDYKGFVSHEQTLANLSNCNAFFALVDYSNNSDWKNGTIGNTKLFEYMMLGKPVICTDFVLWREIIDKWECGIYITPRDVSALHNSLKWIIDNPKKAMKMGENGRRAVEVEFNWSIEEKKLLATYENLV